MRTATLTFQLPEDASDFKIASSAGDLHGALNDVYGYIRGVLKYQQVSEETARHLEEIRALIPFELLGD